MFLTPWALTQNSTLWVGIKYSKAKIRAVSIDIYTSLEQIIPSGMKVMFPF